jgi:putative chitinase
MTYNFNFTSDQVGEILAGNSAASDWFDALSTNLDTFEINTIERVAAFMAQTAHESGNYKITHENLNYSAQGLVNTWPSRFTLEIARQYERQPEKIANHVYANRNGNGDEASGDGWKYKGRGIIQITGRENYHICSHALFSDDGLVIQPDLLETNQDYSVKAACWFWTSKKLNALADVSDIKEITHRINGGYNGLDDRVARYNAALDILRR